MSAARRILHVADRFSGDAHDAVRPGDKRFDDFCEVLVEFGLMREIGAWEFEILIQHSIHARVNPHHFLFQVDWEAPA